MAFRLVPGLGRTFWCLTQTSGVLPSTVGANSSSSKGGRPRLLHGSCHTMEHASDHQNFVCIECRSRETVRHFGILYYLFEKTWSIGVFCGSIQLQRHTDDSSAVARPSIGSTQTAGARPEYSWGMNVLGNPRKSGGHRLILGVRNFGTPHCKTVFEEPIWTSEENMSLQAEANTVMSSL